jgi:pilus assembly protein CpaF
VSFALILPFLKPLEHLLMDPDVSEVMVNGPEGVFVERRGLLAAAEGVRIEESNLRIAVRNIARLLGDDVSEEAPILDARLPDGSRVAAVLPPCSLGGTTLAIRKFQPRLRTCAELVRAGMLTELLVEEIGSALAERRNVLISGGTGTGKTTLLNALVKLVPLSDRIVTVEETAELAVSHPNVVRLEARRAQPGSPAITIRELLRATLRLRPDRIIVGEVRGGEAFDLLQALNTGHSGSLCTIHASSARQALDRMASCVSQSDATLPYQTVRRLITECVHVVVHLERRQGIRAVTEVVRVASGQVTTLGSEDNLSLASSQLECGSGHEAEDADRG